MEEDVLVVKSMKPGRREKKRKIRKISGIVILSILVISLGINFTMGGRRSYFTMNRNNARWVEVNGQKYLHIEAENEFELGKLEGKYLSAKIMNLKRILQLFGALNFKYGFGYSHLIGMAEEYENFIPIVYREEMQGMDEAIVGVTYKDILLQNCFVDILYGKYYPREDINPQTSGIQLGCTVIGYINNNSAIVGQNFDFTNVFKHTLAFVYHKIQGKHAQFTLRVGGLLSIPCGMNAAGTSIFVNVVRTNVNAPYNIPISIKCRQAFDNANNPDEFTDLITQNTSTLSMNLLVANESNIISMEVLPGNYSISKPNQTVNTNTYSDEYFQQYLFDKNYSIYRQNITEELLLNNTIDNKLNTSEFIDILSNSSVYQSESGMMGVSTLICMSTDFFCKGIPSPSDEHTTVPFFF